MTSPAFRSRPARPFAAIALALLACAASPTGAAATPGSGPSGSDTAPPPTLAEVAERAYERFPERGIPESRLEHAAALARQAASPIAGNPAAVLRHQTDRVGARDGLREWEAGLEMPLWRTGQKAARNDLASASGGAAREALQALRWQVAGMVRDVIWSVFTARSQLRQAQREWRTAQALERDVRKRVELGELARTDLLLAQDETLTKHDALLAARAEVAHALQGYTALTGLDRLPRRTAEGRSPLQAVPADHPLLRHLRAELERARAGVAVARRERAEAPSLLVGVRRERGAFDHDSIDSVGLTLRWPIATRAHSAPAITAAQQEIAAAEARLAGARRTLETRFHEAAHELAVIGERLAAAERQAELAREHLRLAELAFSLGEINLVSRLRAQSRAFAAERAVRDLRIRRQMATAAYNQAVGVLP